MPSVVRATANVTGAANSYSQRRAVLKRRPERVFCS